MLPRNSMGGIRRTGDPLEIFESGRAMQMLRIICVEQGCTRTDIYRAVTRNMAMPRKIEELAEAGLIETEVENGILHLYPTEAGLRVSQLLDEISSVIEGASEHSHS